MATAASISFICRRAIIFLALSAIESRISGNNSLLTEECVVKFSNWWWLLLKLPLIGLNVANELMNCISIPAGAEISRRDLVNLKDLQWVANTQGLIQGSFSTDCQKLFVDGLAGAGRRRCRLNARRSLDDRAHAIGDALHRFAEALDVGDNVSRRNIAR